MTNKDNKIEQSRNQFQAASGNKPMPWGDDYAYMDDFNNQTIPWFSHLDLRYAEQTQPTRTTPNAVWRLENPNDAQTVIDHLEVMVAALDAYEDCNPGIRAVIERYRYGVQTQMDFESGEGGV